MFVQQYRADVAAQLCAEYPAGTANGFAIAIWICCGEVTRTDNLKVTYDQEEAHIEITGAHIQPLYIRVRVFRALEIKWVTDRILYIWRDIGPAASVEELIDVIDSKWLSQKCVTDDGAEEGGKGDWL